jgi:predicted ester cyclase
VREKVLATRQMFATVSIRFEDQVAEGDRVASRIVMEGTKTDGGPVSVHLIVISHLADGKIAAEWGLADITGA